MGALDVLGRGRVGAVQTEPRAIAAVTARAVVEGAGPGDDEERRDLLRELGWRGVSSRMSGAVDLNSPNAPSQGALF